MHVKLAAFLVAAAIVAVPPAVAQKIGILEGHTEVGATQNAGKVTFDSKTGAYSVTGCGENIWVSPDAFHFAWKKVTGDFAISADVAVAPSKGNPHRKAVLMFRQSLDADAVYA